MGRVVRKWEAVKVILGEFKHCKGIALSNVDKDGFIPVLLCIPKCFGLIPTFRVHYFRPNTIITI